MARATTRIRANAGALQDAAMACACALDGLGRSEPFVNSMWNAWKTGYRGPWIGPDAISKSATANAMADLGSDGSAGSCTANIRAYTTRMCCREDPIPGQTSVTSGRISGRRLVFLYRNRERPSWIAPCHAV